MSSHEHQVPRDEKADLRWRRLDSTRRRALLRGGDPVDRDEARTSLGFALRMRDRVSLWAAVGAASAFVIVLALELLMDAGVDADTFVLAGAIAVGVGLGLELTGRRRARRLERRARESLAAADEA